VSDLPRYSVHELSGFVSMLHRITAQQKVSLQKRFEFNRDKYPEGALLPTLKDYRPKPELLADVDEAAVRRAAASRYQRDLSIAVNQALHQQLQYQLQLTSLAGQQLEQLQPVSAEQLPQPPKTSPWQASRQVFERHMAGFSQQSRSLDPAPQQPDRLYESNLLVASQDSVYLHLKNN